MNKRIKKKWSRVAKLETKVAQLMAENILLTDAVKRHTRQIEELNSIVSRNVQAANNRFDQLSAEDKALREEVEELEKLKAKKSWFGRK